MPSGKFSEARDKRVAQLREEADGVGFEQVGHHPHRVQVGEDQQQPELETDGVQWDRVMAINLKSVFWVTKHGIPHLQKAGGGSVILVGSVSASIGPGGISIGGSEESVLHVIELATGKETRLTTTGAPRRSC